jgi:small ligand-binding sensory domain FIST
VSSSPFGVAMSLHPVSSIATGEVLGAILESVGYAPGLVVMFVSANHRPHLHEILHATRTIVGPQCLLGSLSKSVFADGYLSNEEPAIVAWASRNSTVTGFSPGRPFRDVFRGLGPENSTVALGTNPGVFADLIHHCSERRRLLVGGVPAGGHREPVQLIFDTEVIDDGLVGIVMAEKLVRPLVSSGAQPIGSPLTVTRAEGRVAYALAFQSAESRMNEAIASLADDERTQLRGGVHIGVELGAEVPTIPNTSVAVGRSELSNALIHEVLGVDRSNGALSVSGELRIGDRVQFYVRDRLNVSAEARLAVTNALASGPVHGALAFASQFRGRKFFGDDESDASVISDYSQAPVAGVFCSHEIGPVLSKPYVHTRYFSAALFGP